MARYRTTIVSNAMNLLISLVFAASLGSQGLDQKVSAEVRAAPAPEALESLSRQIGIPLQGMQSVKKDFLVIRVKDVPASELLKRIASTLNASWEKTDTGYRLLRSPQDVRAEEQKEYLLSLERVKKALERIGGDLKKEKPLTPESAQLLAERLYGAYETQRTGTPNMTAWQMISNLQNSTPAYRLINEISLSIPAETFASVPRGKRIVFASQPTRMQRRMPLDISQAIARFWKDQAIWAKAQKAVKDRRGGENYYYFENTSDPSNSKIGKILLSVTHSPAGNYHSCRITVADQKGRSIASANSSLSAEPNIYFPDQSKPPATNEESIQFKGASKEMADELAKVYAVAMAGRGTLPQMQLPDELKQLILNPEKHEPLSFIATDTLLEVSRIKNKNLVACPDDSMIYAAFAVQNPKPTAVMAMLKSFGTETVEEDKWIILRPSFQQYARQNRTSRSALGDFLRRAVKDGRFSLENRAQFAYNSDQEEQSVLPMFCAILLGFSEEGVMGNDWSSLRLYGSLTTNQRQLAKSGQPIPFSALMPSQIEILRHATFDAEYAHISQQFDEQDTAEFANEDGITLGGGLFSEITEILPNGFTGRELLEVNDETTAKLFAKPLPADGQPSYFGEHSFDEEGLAFELFQAEKPELFPWRNQGSYRAPTFGEFRSGTERRVNMKIQLNKRAAFEQTLTDKTYTSNYVPLAKLPADVKKRIEEAQVRYREQYKDYKPPQTTGGGGGNPSTTTSDEPPLVLPICGEHIRFAADFAVSV